MEMRDLKAETWAATQEAGRPARAGTSRSDGSSGRILVVDDVADNREILTRRLNRRGFSVAEASGGIEALRMIEEETFDLVLLDIMMPDLDGTEVVRSARERHSATELPIIMVSAKSQSEDVAHSLALGANDYITKPVDFTVALARIRGQLDLKRASDSSSETLRQTTERLNDEADGRKKSEERLTYLAYHDELTGLLNRVAFREKLEIVLAEEEMRAADPVVLFIDLDRFKAINDVHGHLAGDELLRRVGERLTQVLSESVAVARLGGDEFAALLLQRGEANLADARAEAVVRALSMPFEVDGRQHQVGASCGVASASDCDFKAEVLMKAADLSMYRAKQAGRSRWVHFEPHFLEEQREQSAIEVALRQAITNGELQLVYQPLVNVKCERLTCFEALLRWTHAERGPISPDVFIPIAEETGLIHELGTWVLKTACAEATTWRKEIRVAVNLAPSQFRHNDLIEAIKQALAETGLEPHRLELEITESGLLEAGERNVQILHEIRDLGVRVSIDDFGTGYSSMSYLQNFVFDKLKIDRRFVRGMSEGPNSSVIIKAIVQLGTGIGIETTAEGIETEEQLAAVIGHGCNEVQGYIFSKPLGAADARSFSADVRWQGGSASEE